MDIKVQDIDDIAILELQRDPTNGFSREFLLQFIDALNMVNEWKHVKVVILSSAKKQIFSSGLDLRSLMGNTMDETAEHVFDAVHLVYKIVEKILSSEKIFIAVLSGAVIGSAVSVSLACDFRIGTSGTWFWLPDPQYGGLLADGGIDLLKNLIGISRAKMMLLTNDRVNSEKAYRWGLLYKVVENRGLEDTAFAEAKRLCSYSANTLGYTKKLVDEGAQSRFKGDELREILKDDEIYTRLQQYIKR
ncbi:enoyl-CoA hydratase/isomerase family protein [Wukongibacter sp. M2B1]|uniref:enoyl-CoA hydratase/isomerase family protein n=1 Tax=Wukongibacter sp. M2B1 TaxID=3088895 RepID=UPI003D796904